MNKLKPCPFCGGKALLSDDGGKYSVFCGDFCVSQWFKYQSAEEAIATWNKRTISQELVDKIRKTYKEYFKNGLHYHNVG